MYSVLCLCCIHPVNHFFATFSKSCIVEKPPLVLVLHSCSCSSQSCGQNQTLGLDEQVKYERERKGSKKKMLKIGH